MKKKTQFPSYPFSAAIIAVIVDTKRTLDGDFKTCTDVVPGTSRKSTPYPVNRTVFHRIKQNLCYDMSRADLQMTGMSFRVSVCVGVYTCVCVCGTLCVHAYTDTVCFTVCTRCV